MVYLIDEKSTMSVLWNIDAGSLLSDKAMTDAIHTASLALIVTL